MFFFFMYTAQYYHKTYRKSLFEFRYYSTARNTTSLWAARNGCREVDTPTHLLSLAKEVTCLEYSGCDKAVVECVFEGGHICNRRWQFEPIIDFMLEDLKSNSTSSNSSNQAMYALISLGAIFMVIIFGVLTYPRRRKENVFAPLHEMEIAPRSEDWEQKEKFQGDHGKFLAVE